MPRHHRSSGMRRCRSRSPGRSAVRAAPPGGGCHCGGATPASHCRPSCSYRTYRARGRCKASPSRRSSAEASASCRGRSHMRHPTPRHCRSSARNQSRSAEARSRHSPCYSSMCQCLRSNSSHFADSGVAPPGSRRTPQMDGRHARSGTRQR